ncbi:hypothetical protein Fcan01_23997 [Folsomia candida]|uniref:Uncharacterized protein n=1 Tax=Folsomia candida TaxID=158441 RepID=A0A226D6F4_FOLCA|nr:hypothetical protein Fcan01_23997 [Folsomia candida]
MARYLLYGTLTFHLVCRGQSEIIALDLTGASCMQKANLCFLPQRFEKLYPQRVACQFECIFDAESNAVNGFDLQGPRDLAVTVVSKSGLFVMSHINSNKSPLGPRARPNQVQIIFIPSISQVVDVDRTRIPIFVIIQDYTLKHFNPTYIFQHVDNPGQTGQNTLSYYREYYDLPGTAPIILFNFKLSHESFIPSVICSIPPLKIRISQDTSSLSKINNLWVKLNNNLHKKLVSINGPPKLPGNQGEVRNIQIKKQMSFGPCKFWLLSRKFKFTLVSQSRTAANAPIYYFSLGLVLKSKTVSDFSTNRKYVINDVTLIPVKFIFVTPFPTAFDGINAFLAPFDSNVWGILFLSCILINSTIRFTHTFASKYTSITELLHHSIHDFLNITAILLRQVNGDTFKMFNNKKWVAVPILTVWFLGGCYIIMDNLYTGSIFSFLTAIKPPLLPSTLETLVDSDYPISTSGNQISPGSVRRYKSSLKLHLIPQYINLSRKIPSKISQILDGLNQKLVYFKILDLRTTRKNLPAKIQEGQPISSTDTNNKLNGSVETRTTFAIMDTTRDLAVLQGLIQSNGSRLITQVKEGTPLIEISFSMSPRTYLRPLFLKQLGNFLAFGLENRWKKLEQLYGPIRLQYILNKDDLLINPPIVPSTIIEVNEMIPNVGNTAFPICRNNPDFNETVK